MFDVGASELLLIVIVAIVVIGPKDLPLALRTAGRWIGKIRRVSGHFRAGLESMIREAELEEMEQKWREQNEAIMKAHPQPAPAAEAGAEGTIAPPSPPLSSPPQPPVAAAELPKHDDRAPQLPLPPV